ncbi:MAG: DUF4340 domain-containing protein [Bacteroidales bacterium]|jgi:hypothetical protein|nr:DUF4340 domain-containing protein [Bacteroidales bacterium]MCK9498938.1 DUF4340 domain-containing protein [Bacteroidales bacterium]MDY0313457.1 DUF4340 domain-containing protein [Bacteroidales bacterium]NLB86129.1 DUF4340 domain-containing protein [Bacteroidales bacterium]
MKKTNIILLIIILVLVIITSGLYFIQNSSNQTSYRDFAVQDTASVDKIFIADKNNNTVLLERKDNYWEANKSFTARRDLTNLLLETFYRIEVSSPVPQSKLDKVLKDISVRGVKCEIYQNGKIAKTYYIGGVTDDNIGTYMIMEGSEQPFIIRIPGFNGFLNVRYNTDINEWREKLIFNYKVQDIAKVVVEYSNFSENSFIAINNGNNSFDLTEINGNKIGFDFDTLKVKTFISSCKLIGFDAFISDSLQQEKYDSLSSLPFVAKYSVEDMQGNIKSFKTYLRQNITKLLDDDGNLYDWDIDYLYGILDDKTVVLLQYYIIDPIATTKSSFIKTNEEFDY